MQNFGLSILMNEVAHFVSLQSTSPLDSLNVLIETTLVNLCEEFFLKYLPVPHVLYFLFLEVNLNRSSAPLDEPKPLVGLSVSLACSSPLEALLDDLLLPPELLLLFGSSHCKGK
jgi:hypothetical protein